MHRSACIPTREEIEAFVQSREAKSSVKSQRSEQTSQTGTDAILEESLDMAKLDSFSELGLMPGSFEQDLDDITFQGVNYDMGHGGELPCEIGWDSSVEDLDFSTTTSVTPPDLLHSFPIDTQFVMIDNTIPVTNGRVYAGFAPDPDFEQSTNLQCFGSPTFASTAATFENSTVSTVTKNKTSTSKATPTSGAYVCQTCNKTKPRLCDLKCVYTTPLTFPGSHH